MLKQFCILESPVKSLIGRHEGTDKDTANAKYDQS